eukprot:1147098-Pelagomonas_calceolata.AAC.7
MKPPVCTILEAHTTSQEFLLASEGAEYQIISQLSVMSIIRTLPEILGPKFGLPSRTSYQEWTWDGLHQPIQDASVKMDDTQKMGNHLFTASQTHYRPQPHTIEPCQQTKEDFPALVHAG